MPAWTPSKFRHEFVCRYDLDDEDYTRIAQIEHASFSDSALTPSQVEECDDYKVGKCIIALDAMKRYPGMDYSESAKMIKAGFDFCDEKLAGYLIFERVYLSERGNVLFSPHDKDRQYPVECDGTILVYSMAVAEQWRRMGAGTKLLHALLEDVQASPEVQRVEFRMDFHQLGPQMFFRNFADILPHTGAGPFDTEPVSATADLLRYTENGKMTDRESVRYIWYKD